MKMRYNHRGKPGKTRAGIKISKSKLFQDLAPDPKYALRKSPTIWLPRLRVCAEPLLTSSYRHRTAELNLAAKKYKRPRGRNKNTRAQSNSVRDIVE